MHALQEVGLISAKKTEGKGKVILSKHMIEHICPARSNHMSFCRSECAAVVPAAPSEKKKKGSLSCPLKSVKRKLVAGMAGICVNLVAGLSTVLFMYVFSKVFPSLVPLSVLASKCETTSCLRGRRGTKISVRVVCY